MKHGKKTDNHNPTAKLALRRHFLQKYHADGKARVLDCCQGSGLLWNQLKREHPIARYWGVDLKPKKGRLKVDSARILESGGWTDDVIDVDAYGSPWRHWLAILTQSKLDALTVFLTVGDTMMRGSLDASAELMLGMNFQRLALPPSFGCKLADAGLIDRACIGSAYKFGYSIAEWRYNHGGGTAAYHGLRLERRPRELEPRAASRNEVTPGKENHG